MLVCTSGRPSAHPPSLIVVSAGTDTDVSPNVPLPRSYVISWITAVAPLISALMKPAVNLPLPDKGAVNANTSGVVVSTIDVPLSEPPAAVTATRPQMSTVEQVGLVEPPPLPVCTRRSDENVPGPVGDPLQAAAAAMRPLIATVRAVRRKANDERGVLTMAEMLRMSVSGVLDKSCGFRSRPC